MFWLGKSISVDTDGTGKKKKNEINLSPLEVIILAQLRSRELRNTGAPVGQYGYEMIKDLNELFAGTWEAKSGTVYPILSKLESKKRMILGTHKKSPLGPVKKIYILEDEGRKSIDYIIHSNFEGNLDFLIHFINLISPFLLNYPNDEDKGESERLLDKIMDIPGKMVDLTKKESYTQIDRKLRTKKLEKLKIRLESNLQEINAELDRNKKI